MRGRVVEAGAGTPIAGAVIRVEGPRLASALSGPDGRWSIADLPAGAYRLTATRVGFARREVEVRAVPAAGELRVPLTPEALPLDALVVTASRRLQRLADAPVATELISRREIEAARVSDLSTLLGERLGIQLEGGHPAGEGVMLQGLGAERVLILMDGEPLVGRLGGTLDVSRIPASMIERIEVVKGPQSALYGSDAMGGVVNLVTRSPGRERWRGGLDLTAGTQGRLDGAATVGGALGGVSALADVGRRSTGLTPGQGDVPGALAERWDALLKLGWAPAAAVRVEASAVLLDERQRWRGGQLYQFADNRQLNARLGAVWSVGAQRLSPSISLSEFRHLPRSATSPAPRAGTGEEEVQRLLEGELLYNLAAGDHALDAGVETRREEIVSGRVVNGERALHSVEPFAQATLALGRLRIVPGARLTWSEQWGMHLTPRLATLLRPLPSLALRASVGRGYRAPAFKELSMEFLNVGPGFAYTVRGNPELRPEESTNLSLGAEWARGTVYLRAQGFHNRFGDFIETELAGDSSGVDVYTYGNVDHGSTRGVELEGGLTRGALRLEGGYAFLRAEHAGTGQPLLGRPAHSGRVSLEHPLPLGVRAALSGTYTGDAPVQRTDDGAALERGGFLRFDLRLARGLPGGLELSLGARNLLDAHPELWPGYAGRHLYLGIGWQASGRPVPTPRTDHGTDP